MTAYDDLLAAGVPTSAARGLILSDLNIPLYPEKEPAMSLPTQTKRLHTKTGPTAIETRRSLAATGAAVVEVQQPGLAATIHMHRDEARRLALNLLIATGDAPPEAEVTYEPQPTSEGRLRVLGGKYTVGADPSTAKRAAGALYALVEGEAAIKAHVEEQKAALAQAERTTGAQRLQAAAGGASVLPMTAALALYDNGARIDGATATRLQGERLGKRVAMSISEVMFPRYRF